MMISGNRRIPLVYGGEKGKDLVYFRYSPIIKRLVPANNAFVTTSTDSSTPSFGNYDWMLIDNTNAVWVADGDLTNIRSTGSTIPIGENYWGYGVDYNQKCIWTGKYWLFGNRKNGDLLRSDITLKSWDITSVAKITASSYDISTNGNNTVAIVNAANSSYLSTDNGVTWTSKDISLLERSCIKTYYSDNLWIITNYQTGVQKSYALVSTNNGANFTSTELSSQVLCICKNPINNVFVAPGRTNVFFSDNNGLSWTSSKISGVTFNLIGEILFDGTNYVGVGLYDGPMWSTDAINWTKYTSNDGSVLNGIDYDYNRLHYNGTRYTFRNGTDNKLYKSTDGKIWSALSHPTQGLWFIDSYPKVQDVNLNLK